MGEKTLMRASLPESWRALPRGLRDAVLEKLLNRQKLQSSGVGLRLMTADLSKPIPASLEQQYFLAQQERHNGKVAWTLAAQPIILEDINEERVRSALEQLMLRHVVLHSTFAKVAGSFELKPQSAAVLPFAITDIPLVAALTRPEKWIKQHYQAMLRKPFDAANGPLWRAELVTQRGPWRLASLLLQSRRRWRIHGHAGQRTAWPSRRNGRAKACANHVLLC